MLNRFRKKDKSLSMSAPESFELYGVTIRKLPMAKYIQVLNALDSLPALLIGEILRDAPEENPVTYLTSLKQEELTAILFRLMSVLPEQVCKLASTLLDIPENRLLDPDATDALSLGEFAEIIYAFYEMNDLSGFFGTVRRLKTAVTSAQNTGSSAGLPSDKVSA